jgi:ABC-type transport system substrate-binding protein
MPATSRSDADDLGDELDGLTVVREPSLSSLGIALRVDQPPFADERVRRALDLLIDRAALIAAVGNERPDARICGPVNPNLSGGFWSLSEADVEASHGTGTAAERREEANTLLTAAGATGLAFEMQAAQVPELLGVASAVRDQLATAGVMLTVRPLPVLEWYLRSRRGDFTSTLIAHPPYETPDGALRWHHTDGPDGTGNPMGFSNSGIDGAIGRARAEGDRDTRGDHVLEAQRAIVEQRAMLHLFTGSGYTCVWDYVRDSGLERSGSLSRYHYRQWLALPVEGRPD